MRAVTVRAFGGPEQLRVEEVQEPPIGDRQVRVEVQVAAVNPVDLVTRAGALHATGLHEGTPLRLGWDVFGEVQAVGAGVRRLHAGQAVIGLSDRLAAPSKTHAEQVVLDEDAVAAVPSDLDPMIGACLPLAGSTAWQSLDRLDLRSGQSVLVTGAGGAVGSLAVQLARLRGLRAVAAARSRDVDRVQALGADCVVEAGPAVAEVVRGRIPGGVDGAVDAAGLGNASLDAVGDRGGHVSLNVTDHPAPLRGIRSDSLAVVADWRQLTVLASLAATGVLQVSIARQLLLDEVQEAHQLLAAGGVPGRIVLTP